MNIQSLQESACHYLFGKEAAEVFNSSKFTDEFVNQSLETLMRVNAAFLSRQKNDGFSLLDPAAFNNQCHIYSLLAAKIRKTYKEKTTEEKLAQTKENRFLHLSFLLAWTFLTERRLLSQAIQVAADNQEITLPSNRKLFDEFVKDSEGKLIRTARLALNEVFANCIQETFHAARENSLLHRELYQLSLEDLQCPPSRGDKTLYTLPKLAGVAYLVNEKISIIIKAKIITSAGTETMVYQSAPLEADDPVLVFEAIASEEFSIETYEALAKRCPTYFFRNVGSANRHSEKQTCLFCTHNRVDPKPYQVRFAKATEHIQETLYALGADFVRELQLTFMKFFKDDVKYPLLAEIFQKAVLNIDKLGLSMKKPLAFTVDHVYLDDAQHALQPQLRMDSSPEAYLKSRGFL